MNILFDPSMGAYALVEPDIEELSENVIRLRATIGFQYGSRLEVRVTIDMSNDNPAWRLYSFHYMTDQNLCVFRYDNVEHHSEMWSFPDHKHEGPDEKVIPCHQPSIRRIQSEIEAYLKAKG